MTEHLYNRKKGAKIGETLFNIIYLVSAAVIGIILAASQRSDAELIAGIIALTLTAGDFCHIFPRIASMWDKSIKDYNAHLGAGKLTASLTMTLFYIGLWAIAVIHFKFTGTIITVLSVIFAALTALRIVLCLMPQNGWLKNTGSKKWGIIRNIPFIIIGLMTAALYIYVSNIIGALILISFACYVPVLIWADKYPKIGMLMLPKSCAYLAMIALFLAL